MPSKPGHNPDNFTMLTCRIEKTLHDRLRRIAGRRQALSGRFVATSDVVRLALAAYCEQYESDEHGRN